MRCWCAAGAVPAQGVVLDTHRGRGVMLVNVVARHPLVYDDHVDEHKDCTSDEGELLDGELTLGFFRSCPPPGRRYACDGRRHACDARGDAGSRHS